MNKQSNSYTIIYSIVLIVIVAFILSFAALSLSGRQKENVEMEKKGNILESVGLLKVEKGQDKDAVIKKDYPLYIKGSYLINRAGEVVSSDETTTFNVFINLTKEYSKPEADQQLPLFVAEVDGSQKYIFPVQGTGLWGPVWGYVALDSNLNTIYGVVFDHSSETPGLGAEITQPGFTKQFIGKTIFDGSDFVGIKVVKGTAEGNTHEVDAISGGTITSRAVEEMINLNMGAYKEYILKNRK